MSVLIQGMEMPESFDHLFVGENMAGDLFIRNDTQEGDKVVWYPLIEIPTHGRLIDADELETDTEYDIDLDDFIGYSKEQIRSAPTIIPADKEEHDGT